MPDLFTELWQSIAAPGVAQDEALDDDLITRLADCPRYQGALAILIAGLLTPSATSPAIPCHVCENTLAAFIDYEREFGLTATIPIFPATWYHMLTCSACWAFYCDLHELLAMGPIAPQDSARTSP